MKFELDPRLKPFTVPISLGVGLLLLVIVILLEWFAFRHSLAQDNKTSRAPNPQTLGGEVSLDGLGLPAVHEFSETVERPLFMETRRPSPPAPPGPPPRSEPPAPVTFQLMGVIESPKGRLALIAEAKGKYRRLHLKDAIDGWEVTEIRDDRLFLEQGGLKQDIGLTKKRAKTAGDKSPPPQQEAAQENQAAQRNHPHQQPPQGQQNGVPVAQQAYQQQPRPSSGEQAQSPEDARQSPEDVTEEN
ncbi:MAG: hypothetical protein RLZZ627_606 [Pseudomonadota bacterium]|jgi:hypothetical protein